MAAPKRVQIRGLATSQLATEVGRDREMIIDITKQVMTIHDGVVTGGRELARADLSNVANATGAQDGKMTPELVNQIVANTDAIAAIPSDAASVTFDPASTIYTGTDVQAVLVESSLAFVALDAELTAHVDDTNNPHVVTAAQLGAMEILANLSDVDDVPTALANLGISAQDIANWIAGTAVDESIVSPAKIRAAVSSYLNWPAGQVLMRASVTAKPGLLRCNGASYLQSAHPALFAEIGTTFGGDVTHFNVPPADDAFLMALGTGAIGDTGGAATVTLAAAESGRPEVTISVSTRGSAQEGVTDPARLAQANTNGPSGTFDITIPATDAAAAHENLPPYLKLPCFITTGGT